MAMKYPDRSAFGYTVADMTRLMRRVFDRRSAQLGLTRAQWRALSRIERAEGLTQSELAEDLDLEPISVGRVIDRLESAGFVERRADPVDGPAGRGARRRQRRRFHGDHARAREGQGHTQRTGQGRPPRRVPQERLTP